MAKTLKRAAGWAANSPLLRRGKNLFQKNSGNWNLPMSKFDKLRAGGWLILDDYSKGIFPPTFPDQQKAYLNEKAYRSSIPGMSAEEFFRGNMTKPFWFGGERHYIGDFLKVSGSLNKLNVKPPSKLLELGCGSGWMTEFFAVMGFHITGTTLAEDDIADAQRRAKSIEAKGLPFSMKLVACPMESVHQAVENNFFDAAFVYEALHHAFDWRETIKSAHACLRDGGWLLICSEPNVLHTFI